MSLPRKSYDLGDIDADELQYTAKLVEDLSKTLQDIEKSVDSDIGAEALSMGHDQLVFEPKKRNFHG